MCTVANQRIITLSDEVDNFYKKYIDGKFVSDKELDFALDAAWQPAISGMKRRNADNYPSKVVIMGKSGDKEDNGFKNTLKDALSIAIASGEFSKANKQDFDKSMIGFCKNQNKELKKLIDDSSDKLCYFGIMQKYVNIVFKYLYCFNIKCGLQCNINFENCHCPIDRIITETVKRKVLGKANNTIIEKSNNTIKEKSNNTIKEIIGTGKSWSFINEDTYTDFQEIIRDFRAEPGVNIESNLFFDFLYW